MHTENSVIRVAQRGMCTGCGTCASTCPNNAVRLRIDTDKGTYEPEIRQELCNSCGICLETCPGEEVDFGALDQEVFSRNRENLFIGNLLNCQIGYANDPVLRYEASSGGLVTQLLIVALENGLVDGVIVGRMRLDNPLVGESFIARTREEVIKAKGSKYCPVPVNEIIGQILKSSKEERFAVVGLPCHIHGIRKAQHIHPQLRKRIVLCLGLFCGGYYTVRGLEFLLDGISVQRDSISNLTFRGLGWPGSMTITDKNAKSMMIPYQRYSSLIGPAFFPPRCTLCVDALNEFADISFGDAWGLPRFGREGKGISIVVSRTVAGEGLVDLAIKSKQIQVLPLPVDELIVSQKGLLSSKKKSFLVKAKLCESFLDVRAPTYFGPGFAKEFSAMSLIRSIFTYSLMLTGRKRHFWRLLRAAMKSWHEISSSISRLRGI